MPKLGKAEIERRLKRHLATLKAGKDVTKRDLRALLTDDQLKDYEEQWESQRNFRQWLYDMRSTISKYQEIVKTADAYHVRAEKARSTPKAAVNARRAEKHYERAFEHLEELQNEDPWISELFDRPLDQDPSWETGPSYHGIPRYIFSQSHACNREKRESLPTKRDVKIQIIQEAIKSLGREPTQAEQELEATRAVEATKRRQRLLQRTRRR